MTTMLTWQADGRPGLEGARVQLPSAGALRAHGRIVRPDPAGDFTVAYAVATRDDGTHARLTVSLSSAGPEKDFTVSRSAEGFWLVDDGSGSRRTDFDGALDIDLAYSPLFNSLPIRRLGAHRQPVDAEVPVVFVSLPELAVRTVVQRYRTVRLAEGPGESSIVEFSTLAGPDADGDRAAWFSAELEVDAEGFVVRYPGLATLLSAHRPAPAAP